MEMTISFVMVVVIIILATLFILRPPKKGPRIVASVTGFAVYDSSLNPRRMLVLETAPDGRRGRGAASIEQLKNLRCKVGDEVISHAVGGGLAVDAKTCGKVPR